MHHGKRSQDWIKSALVLCGLLIGFGAEPAFASGRKWAILVGVEHYQRVDIVPLQFAVADVKGVGAALADRCGYARDDVFTLTSDQSGDDAPTRANIAFRLGWLADRVHPEDTVLFYFSGHGMHMDQNSYLLTVEADARNAQTLRLTCFDITELNRTLKDLKCQQLFVIVDACRNDPRSAKGSMPNFLDRDIALSLRVQGRAVEQVASSVTATFYACSEGQRSYEWPDKGHGFFSYYLIEALSGRSGATDGQLTVPELAAYLDRTVSGAVERSVGVKQQPWIASEGAGLSRAVVVPPVADLHATTITPAASPSLAPLWSNPWLKPRFPWQPPPKIGLANGTNTFPLLPDPPIPHWDFRMHVTPTPSPTASPAPFSWMNALEPLGKPRFDIPLVKVRHPAGLGGGLFSPTVMAMLTFDQQLVGKWQKSYKDLSNLYHFLSFTIESTGKCRYSDTTLLLTPYTTSTGTMTTTHGRYHIHFDSGARSGQDEDGKYAVSKAQELQLYPSPFYFLNTWTHSGLITH